MVWNASHLLWQQQLIVIGFLVTPVFLLSIGLALVVPRYFPPKSALDKQTPTEKIGNRNPVAQSR